MTKIVFQCVERISVYMGLKMFNTVPVYIKQEFDIPKKFESLTKKFLYEKLFVPWKNFTDYLNLNIHS